MNIDQKIEETKKRVEQAEEILHEIHGLIFTVAGKILDAKSELDNLYEEKKKETS